MSDIDLSDEIQRALGSLPDGDKREVGARVNAILAELENPTSSAVALNRNA